MVGWVDGWMGGWVDGWVVGWIDGSKSGYKDCLQQSKKLQLFVINKQKFPFYNNQ
jgi:hypothetical protein